MRRSMRPTRFTTSCRRRSLSFFSARWRCCAWPPLCCTARRLPASASSALIWRRCWSRPPSRITGRSTSTSPSSMRAAFALARYRLWRWLALTALVLGALWALPGTDHRFRHRQALGAHVFHAVAGFALVATFLVCGLLYGPPSESRRDRPRLRLRAVGLSLGRHAPGAGEPARSARAHGLRRFSPSRLSASPGAPRPRPPPCR